MIQMLECASLSFSMLNAFWTYWINSYKDNFSVQDVNELDLE